MTVYLTILGATVLAALLLTPLARRLALRWGIVDQPDVRKMHREPVPYLGGLAVFVAILLGLGTLLVLARDPGRSFEKMDPRMLAVVGGAALMFGLGLWDDVKRLRARHKLLVQLVVAAGMWFAGIRIEQIRITDGFVLDFGVFAFPITVLWIAGVTNAINLIDGLDGLAAGIGAISAAAIGYVAFQSHQYPTTALMAILMGALLGFLPHNRHPARIFLGDCGSLTIGFLLATCAITTASKSAAFVSVAAPFIALSVPILDMCFAMMRRMIERRGIFSPDRNHIHHRLLAIGFGHAKTVYILWAESAAVTALALFLLYSGTNNIERVLAFSIVVGIHVVFFWASGAVRMGDSYRAFKAAAARRRETSGQQRDYDELDLHFRATKTIDDWWQAVELTAAKLGFVRLDLAMTRREGGVRHLRWTPSSNGYLGPLLRSSVPVRQRRSGGALHIAIEVPVTSLESAGQRLTLFGRLLDRHSIAELPSLPSTRNSTPIGNTWRPVEAAR